MNIQSKLLLCLLLGGAVVFPSHSLAMEDEKSQQLHRFTMEDEDEKAPQPSPMQQKLQDACQDIEAKAASAGIDSWVQNNEYKNFPNRDDKTYEFSVKMNPIVVEYRKASRLLGSGELDLITLTYGLNPADHLVLDKLLHFYNETTDKFLAVLNDLPSIKNFTFDENFDETQWKEEVLSKGHEYQDLLDRIKHLKDLNITKENMNELKQKWYAECESDPNMKAAAELKIQEEAAKRKLIEEEKQIAKELKAREEAAKRKLIEEEKQIAEELRRMQEEKRIAEEKAMRKKAELDWYAESLDIFKGMLRSVEEVMGEEEGVMKVSGRVQFTRMDEVLSRLLGNTFSYLTREELIKKAEQIQIQVGDTKLSTARHIKGWAGPKDSDYPHVVKALQAIDAFDPDNGLTMIIYDQGSNCMRGLDGRAKYALLQILSGKAEEKIKSLSQ